MNPRLGKMPRRFKSKSARCRVAANAHVASLWTGISSTLCACLRGSPNQHHVKIAAKMTATIIAIAIESAMTRDTRKISAYVPIARGSIAHARKELESFRKCAETL